MAEHSCNMLGHAFKTLLTIQGELTSVVVWKHNGNILIECSVLLACWV